MCVCVELRVPDQARCSRVCLCGYAVVVGRFSDRRSLLAFQTCTPALVPASMRVARRQYLLLLFLGAIVSVSLAEETPPEGKDVEQQMVSLSTIGPEVPMYYQLITQSSYSCQCSPKWLLTGLLRSRVCLTFMPTDETPHQFTSSWLIRQIFPDLSPLLFVHAENGSEQSVENGD